jgi:subtilisin family serine protease
VPLWVTGTGPYGEPPYYRYMSGTSMASPFVAAAAGLVWSAHPTLSATEVTQTLLSNATVPTGWDSRYGVGRLNVARAVNPPVLSFRVFLPVAVR